MQVENSEITTKKRKAKVEPNSKRRRVRCNKTFIDLLKQSAQEINLTKEQSETIAGFTCEKVNEKYYRVKYFNLDLVMDTSGFCNATNMCALGGKDFNSWLDTKYAKESLKVLSEVLKCEVMYQENSHEVDEAIRGTYVHPDLIIIIGVWISTIFAIGISRILNDWKTLNFQNNITFCSLLSTGLAHAKAISFTL